MSVNLPPNPYIPNLYNSNDYFHNDQSLTIGIGDLRYLQLTGGTLTGNLFCSNNLSMNGTLTLNGFNLTATATELNYNHGLTPGTGSASLSLVLDSSRNINNINNLTATNLTGTLQTAAQPNITTVGNLSSLTMFGDITMSGHNVASANTISCSTLNVSNVFNITATIDSSSPSTGSFTSLGGVGIAKSLYVGTGITVPNASGGNLLTLASTDTSARSTIYFQTDITNWEMGTRGSTAQYPNSFYLYNGSFKLIINPTGDTTLFSGTDATSTTSGALQVAGGISCQKQLWVASNANIGSTARVTGSSPPSSGSGLELAFASSTSNIYSYNRSTLTYLDLNLNDKVLISGSSGNVTISSTTDATSRTTGALQVAGGISCQQQLWAGRINSDYNGSNFSMTNGSNSGLIELAASPNILRVVNGYALNVGALGVTCASASIQAPRFALDFQASPSDLKICLYGGTASGSAVYGFGANNSAVEYHSAGDHVWFNNSTISGSSVTLGSKIATVSSGGNLIMSAGGFFQGFSSTDLSGAGIKLHYGGSIAQIFGYDYTAGSYRPMQIGPNMQINSSGFINISSSNTVCAFPLAVFGTAAASRGSSFGWLSNAGTGTASGFSGRQFSLYTDGGILVNSGEIDSFSDLRLKKDVQPLDESLVLRFIQNINPIAFKYTHNDAREHYGFSAQELVKYGFDRLVGYSDYSDYNTIPIMQIECIDGQTIDLPSDKRLTVTQLDIIPILHRALQMQQAMIDELRESINSISAKPTQPTNVNKSKRIQLI